MSVRKQYLEPAAVSLLVGCCVFWGFQQVLVKVTIPEVAPVYQAAIRFLVATLIVLGWCAARGLRFDAEGLAPLSALAFGVALLNEPVSISLVAAMVSVAIGIVLVNRRT
jgi:drug/metabolite transporter (DMT)-like permease